MSRGPKTGANRGAVSSLETARAAWGENLPAWVKRLAEECDAPGSSQNKVARAIRYSPAVVSSVLRGTYKGDSTAVERAVRGAFLGDTVYCPIDGEIGADRCNAQQRAPLCTGNTRAIQLYRACRAGCPHARLDGKGDSDGK